MVRTCPDAGSLEQLLLGRIPAAGAAPLEEHLAVCPRCAQTAERLHAEDGLVEAVRASRQPEPASNDEMMGAMVPWLKRLRRHPASQLPLPAAGLSETVSVGPAAASGDTSLQGASVGRRDDLSDATVATFDFLAPPQAADEMGRLGPYRVLEPLGAGGMGMVFRADDPRLKRQIALKVIKPDLVSQTEVRERFLREAQAIAALEHDNIVAIFQVDEDRGIPYLAMPLLRGESLEDRLRGEGGPLPTDETLRIGREIAAGLAAAHERGLVHRDIKPGNIWLEGDKGRVKVLDFGLAEVAQRLKEDKGKVYGTPAYMAPEQGMGEDVDHRADLFSLGCVLYRMATGRPPFEGSDALSTLLSVVRDEPAAPGTLNPQLAPALADLIVQLLAKKPAGRPASAGAVVEAIEKIEEARRPKPSRRRWYVLIAAAVLSAVGLTAWLLPRGGEPADPGEVIFAYDEPDRRLLLRRGDEPEQSIDLRDGLRHTLPAGEYAVRAASEVKGRRLLPDHFLVKPAAAREVELRMVGEIRQDGSHTRAVWDVALSPKKGSLLALSAGDDRTVRMWDAGHEGGSALLGEQDGPVHCVAISADGRLGLSAGGGRGVPAGRRLPDFSIHIWDLEKRQHLASLSGHTRMVTALAFTPDGRRFLSGADDGLFLWDARTHKTLFQVEAHDREGVRGGAFSPDGRRAVTAGGDKRVVLWDAERGTVVKKIEGHSDRVSGVAFVSAGVAAASSWDGSVRIWDLSTGESRVLRGHEGSVQCVACSADGSRLLSGGDDATVRLWDVATGEAIYSFLGHKGAVHGVAFSADGRRGISGGMDRTVRLWELPR